MSDIRKQYEAEHGKRVSPNNEEGEEIPQFITSKLVLTEKSDKTLYEYLRGLLLLGILSKSILSMKQSPRSLL